MTSPHRIRAWQAAIQVAVKTRDLVGHFPARGYAELRDQMIRSAESIGNNIAEGRGSDSDREYAHYLDNAVRSAAELSSQITMSIEYGIVPKWKAFNLNGTVIRNRLMIEALRDAVRANAKRRASSKRSSSKRSSS